MNPGKLAERADPDCADCGGTGIIEGQEYGIPGEAWWKDADEVCPCVPLIEIRAEELTPICPSCGAVAQRVLDPVTGTVLETVHEDDCAWMHDIDSEPYT
jgi:hypothetical protein